MMNSPPTSIRIRKDGPLIVTGSVEITGSDGQPIELPDTDKNNVALCRCGHSSCKPFCDGAHRVHGFHDD